MSSLLEINSLHFSYGTRQILTDIALQLTRGSFVTIVGPNGSGKSTLLKNITAILPPQKGTVHLENENIFKIKPAALARKMAVVPQDTMVQFSFTVLETVLMGRTPYLKRFQGESSQDLDIVQWAMESTGTWDLRGRLITDISGGERQRVIVARALAQQPQILLLDEPIAFLDLQHQLGLLELLQKLTRQNQLTVLAVLHDLNLAAQFSDRIILLHGSRIFAAGSPEQVLTAAHIRQVYGIEVLVTPNHLTDKFNIIPLATSLPQTQPHKAPNIHLICGGNTGSAMMDQLVQQGYQVSCGVLNIGDSDWGKAKALSLDHVAEEPFTGIKPATYQKNQLLLQKADLIVVLNIPFGSGNLGNLQQAQKALEQGKPVYLVGDPEDIGQRDFTQGQASHIYRAMARSGAQVLTNSQQLLGLLAAK